MKTRNKSKLIASVAMLVVSAIAVTSASYAWFTMNKEVSATTLSLTAAAPANVQISLIGTPEAADWSDEVALTATTKALRPVSTATAFDGSFFDSKKNEAIVSTATDAFQAATNPADQNWLYYYDIPVWFRAKGTYDIDLALKTLSLHSDALNGALRVAFINDAKDGNSYNDATTHLIFAGANTAYNAASGASAFTEVTPKVAADLVKVDKISVDKTNVNSYKADLITKVIIRVYLEGQDAACKNDNNQTNTSLTVGLVFGASEITA